MRQRAAEVTSVVPVFALLVACGSSAPAPRTAGNDEGAPCASDADCAMTTFAGCCSCCRSAPRATSRNEVQRDEDHCAVVSCGGSCKGVECAKDEPVEAFEALCREGTCVSAQRR